MICLLRAWREKSTDGGGISLFSREWATSNPAWDTKRGGYHLLFYSTYYSADVGYCYQQWTSGRGVTILLSSHSIHHPPCDTYMWWQSFSCPLSQDSAEAHYSTTAIHHATIIDNIPKCSQYRSDFPVIIAFFLLLLLCLHGRNYSCPKFHPARRESCFWTGRVIVAALYLQS